MNIKKKIVKKPVAKVVSKPAPKAKAAAVSRVKIVEELSGKAKKLVSDIDKAVAAIESAKATIQSSLPALQDALGAATFVHPAQGVMTIMERGGAWFWRPKPSGGGRKAAGAKKAEKAEKPAKKAEKAPVPVKKVIRRKPAADEATSDDE